MEQKLLNSLNGRLASEFGYNFLGGANYKWTLTTELFGYTKRGLQSPVLTPEGIYAVPTRYIRYTFADLAGVAWALSKWKYWRRGEWLRTHGTDFPWPAEGEYEIVGAAMPPGEEPDMEVTIALAYHLRRHLGMSIGDHEQEALVKLHQQHKDTQGPIEDEIDDSFFAFDHLPGAKDHVSLPSVQPKLQETVSP